MSFTPLSAEVLELRKECLKLCPDMHIAELASGGLTYSGRLGRESFELELPEGDADGRGLRQILSFLKSAPERKAERGEA